MLKRLLKNKKFWSAVAIAAAASGAAVDPRLVPAIVQAAQAISEATEPAPADIRIEQ